MVVFIQLAFFKEKVVMLLLDLFVQIFSGETTLISL